MVKYVFSIDGNIGSGKSTIIKYLIDHEIVIENYKLFFLPEPVDIWETIKDSSGVTILEKYYSDSKRYAFSFQMMAYISRLSQLKKIINESPENSIIISERCLNTDREIFAKMLYDSGKIEEIEYSIYLRWFDEFNIDITGIIYIKTTPEICLSRVNQRNRKGETIPLSYLTECHNYHENWLTNVKFNDCNVNFNVIILDGNETNNVDKIKDITDFIKNLIYDQIC